MSLASTGPGPVWAKGGEMVTVSLGSEPRLSVLSSGLGPCADRLSCWGFSPAPELTDNTSISVMFQKAFQKCTSRFWMMRSNSAPRNSGSMANRPPCSPKDTSPMERVCRNGRMAGVNCEGMPVSPNRPRQMRGGGGTRWDTERRRHIHLASF
ncbi:AC121639.1 [Phodopus roborovskii]|uniref:AC121639.1 protein n=1 Tax=Phodopus roborovskii TaxID=109678 RepID=A0AAV0A9P8_PHORO|nr:AC121639.1 [Phodopus roborovskii]